jgi:hypothetical protein
VAITYRSVGAFRSHGNLYLGDPCHLQSMKESVLEDGLPQGLFPIYAAYENGKLACICIAFEEEILFQSEDVAEQLKRVQVSEPSRLQ